MEKLIELLNEYEGQDTWSYDEEMGMPYYGWGDDCDYEAYLISKKYGFIKWLVENDKTYLECFKVYRLDLKPMEHKYVEYSTYEQTLMLLSIQDNPIGFLISILK